MELERERLSGSHRTGQRQPAVEHVPQPGTEHDPDVLEPRPEVGRAHRERRPRASRPGDAPERHARGPVVPGRRDDERVVAERACDRLGRGAVVERTERLGDAEERDPCGVVGVPVVVRVDGPFEAGHQLVRAPIEREGPPRVALPACDTDGQERGARGDPRQAEWPSGAGHEAGELCPVPLELAAPRARLCLGGVVAVHDVDAFEDAPAQEAVAHVHAGVEQRDRDPAAVEARQASFGAVGRTRRDRPALEALRGDRRGVGGTHRIDAPNVPGALEQGDAARVERRREARQDARVAVLRPDPDSLRRQAGDQLLLRDLRDRVPALQPGLRRPAPRLGQPFRQGRYAQQDDHALPDGNLRPGPADETAPGGGGRRLRGARIVGLACSARDGDGGRSERDHGEQQDAGRPTERRRHRPQGTRDT